MWMGNQLNQQLFVAVVWLFFITGCGFPEPFPAPSEKKSVSLKVINYNLWHGLGDGYFKREELEPEQHKKDRYEEQIKRFQAVKPDILFLQEVHPSSSRAGAIAKALGMSVVYHQSNCGVSFFGLGVPVNLDIGLAILVRPPLKIKKILGLKLSGPPGFCDTWLTFQYGEFRYGLFALAWHPDYGSFLLVGTHFHHGPEWSAPLREKIKEWQNSNLLDSSQVEELTEAINKSNKRRERELENIFNQIQELKTHYTDMPLLLAGDFNSTVESPVYKSIIETHRLKDSMGNFSPTPYTWDPAKNQKNHRYTSQFAPPVPTFEKTEVSNFFKEYDSRPRRIDYVFVSQGIRVLSHNLFSDKANDQGLIPSDHFGLEIQLNAEK